VALEPSELLTLRAALDRIIPEDDFPSATELGCDDYIERLMHRQFWLTDAYRAGLGLLDVLSAPKRFCELDLAAQDAALIKLEGNAFFDLVVQHAMEGYYSDPGNGGNRDGLAWKMVGFEVTL
jgi:gluconate 2-dehydrogenase gamma chain